jgi:hypothetical protein
MAERELDKLVDQVGNYIYIGTAPPGTPSAAQAWKIVRMNTSPIEKRYAQGNSEFVHTWDNRIGYQYDPVV